MAVQDKNTLKTYFETGNTPSQNQFVDLIDSLKHKNDISFNNLSNKEIMQMANRLASIGNGTIEYYRIDIGNSVVKLEVVQKNAENQIIEIKDAKSGQSIKQYFLGDAPYTIRLKDFQGEELGPNEYYYLFWRSDKDYGMRRLLGCRFYQTCPKVLSLGQ